MRGARGRPRQAAEGCWEDAVGPDTVLASQLGDEPLAAAQLQPEKRLQLAVLVPVLTQPWTPELGLDGLRRSVPTDDAAHGSASGRGVGYICPTLQLTRTCSI